MRTTALNLQGGDGRDCGPDCAAFVDKWSKWWQVKTRVPLALLRIEPIGDYLQTIGPKSRNMVSKANRLYEYRHIEFNEHLADIEHVAQSKSERQGIPMEGWYTEPVVAQTPAKLCAIHRDEWHGGFSREDGSMVAFARIEVLNQLGILNSILGHPDAGGAVNGIIAHLVEHVGVRWINYLYPQAKTETLADFKRRLGFQAVQVG